MNKAAASHDKSKDQQEPILFRPTTLSNLMGARATFLMKCAAYSPLADAIQDAVAACESDYTDAEQAMRAMHRLQRLYVVHQMGMEDNAKLVEALQDEARYPLWDAYASVPMHDAQKDRLAHLMYEGDAERRAPILLIAEDYSRTIAERVLVRCVREKDDVLVWIDDPIFTRCLLTQCGEEQATRYGAVMAERHTHVARSIVLSVDTQSIPYADAPPMQAVQDAMRRAYYGGRDRAGTRSQMYTLTSFPTPKDAERDGIPYETYVALYCAMCDVDWKEMDAAQKHLIAKLNAGSVLRFVNDDGTDLTMDVSGMTFCNSLVAKNVPGSEAFSAPHRDSVNGTIVAKGRFNSPLDPDAIIEDITLAFKDGRVTAFQAESGEEYLRRAIELDEGSCYVGEIGIGTNPQLRHHLINGLMVEKIGGSFHVALGTSYQFKEYGGVAVNVDNGNRSDLHWDITTMLWGKNGKIILDGEEIMTDGRFNDPKLAYLNRKPSITLAV